MTEVADPAMTGSKDPLILRNYRVIYPSTTRYFNLHADRLKYQGQHIYQRDIDLHFKIGAAPVILPYESELVITIYLEVTVPNMVDEKKQAVNSFLQTLISNEWTPVPLYRIKAKSVSHCVKYTNATMANSTFQSYRLPIYLNEIILRKPFLQQQKYPDNYTGEKSVYFDKNYRPNLSNDMGVFLRPLTRSMPNESPLIFMTPQLSSNSTLVPLTFRIPFTELLPVFKIGVIPLITVPNMTMDLDLGLYNPALWLMLNKTVFWTYAFMETHLNISTVSFPNINPLADALIRPRIFGNTFIASYLDYLTWDVYVEMDRGSVDFFFNITQALKNVPFMAITFTDLTHYSVNTEQRLSNYSSSNVGGILREGPTNFPVSNISMANVVVKPSDSEGLLQTLEAGFPTQISLLPEERIRGGFFSLPPEIYCDDLTIRLGEAAYPATQIPMTWADMYMYNRKHFEMYGRDFNTNRISPLGRAYTGDATFFFDLSHSPMAGFEISGDSPLQVSGYLKNPKFPKITDYATEQDVAVLKPRIQVTLTLYYTNRFVVKLDTGGVLPLQ